MPDDRRNARATRVLLCIAICYLQSLKGAETTKTSLRRTTSDMLNHNKMTQGSQSMGYEPPTSTPPMLSPLYIPSELGI